MELAERAGAAARERADAVWSSASPTGGSALATRLTCDAEWGRLGGKTDPIIVDDSHPANDPELPRRVQALVDVRPRPLLALLRNPVRPAPDAASLAAEPLVSRSGLEPVADTE